MPTHKSPGRELAEKMWFDITGRMPTGSSPPVEASSSEEGPKSAPVLGSFPDLNQSVQPEPAPPDTPPEEAKEISPFAVGTLIAGVVLGGLVVWAILFARGERPPVAEGPQPIRQAAGSTPTSGVIDSLSNEVRPTGFPGIGEQSAPRSAPVGSPPVPVHTFTTPPSAEGWTIGEGGSGSRGGSPLVGSASWSSRSPSLTPNQAEAEAIITGQDPGLKPTASASRGGHAIGSPAAEPSPNPVGTDWLPANVAQWSGATATIQASAGGANPPSSDQENPASRTVQTFGGLGDLPTSVTPRSADTPASADVIATSTTTAPAQTVHTQEGNESFEKANLIAGLEWLRGEREFTSRSAPAGQRARAPGEVAPPITEIAGGTSAPSQIGASPAYPALPPTSPPFVAGANPATSVQQTTPVLAGIPAVSVAQLPQTLPTAASGPVGTPASPVTGLGSTPGAAMVPAGSSPVSGYYMPPTLPAVGTSQMIVNPTVVSNPTVIPTGAWQSLDASSFRWNSAARVAPGIPGIQDYNVQSALLSPQMPTAPTAQFGTSGPLPPAGLPPASPPVYPSAGYAPIPGAGYPSGPSSVGLQPNVPAGAGGFAPAVTGSPLQPPAGSSPAPGHVYYR